MRATLVVGKSHNQNAVGRGHADGHDRAHERGNIERRPAQKKHPDDSAQRAGQRHDDDERVGPRLEIHDHQEVNEDDGKDETAAETCERAIHALDLPTNTRERAARQFRFETVYHFVDFIGHAAEIARLHVGKHVKNRLHIVMVHDDRRFAPLDRREISEKLGAGQIRSHDRCILQVLQRVHFILRRLHGDLVVHAVLKIEPVVGRGLTA